MNNLDKIGILDSGLGGASVLKEIIRLIPNAHYLYLSDSKNIPYGEKSQEEIKNIVLNNIQFLIDSGCKIIVVACNTATAVAIEDARSIWNIPIIGMEPAIKIVHDNPVLGNTLLLATSATINSERFNKLKLKYSIDNLIVHPCNGLADLIEERQFEKIEQYIKSNLLYSDISCVILGCTHYPLVKDIFEKYFKNSLIIDGSIGTAKQVFKKCEEINFKTGQFYLEFIDTSDNKDKLNNFNYYLKNN